jgi:tetratricopeptide (TPR) repeat protein
MQGNFERTNLADVLLSLHLAKRNGILRLARDDIKKSIYFLEGAIVFAHSNQKHDRLGETLLRLGKITQEEFETSSREVIEKGRRLGQVLSDLEFISAQEVNSAVHYQLQQIIYSLFDWDSGEFEFIERERPVFEDIMIDISTPTIIIDGIRSITNPAVLGRIYNRNENQVLRMQTGVPRLARPELYYAEETILACVDGVKTIEAVRQLSHLSPMEFERAIYSLLLSGILQVGNDSEVLDPMKKSDEQLRANVQQRWSYATQPMPGEDQEGKGRASLKTLSEQELRQLIQITMRKFQNTTDEEVLNVLPDCTMQEVHKAFEELCLQFHPPYYSPDRFLDIKNSLKWVLDRITLAHDNLIARITSRMPFGEAPFDSPPAPPPEELDIFEDLPQPLPQAAAPPPAPPPPSVVSVKKVPVQKIENENESLADLQERIRLEPQNTMLLRKLAVKLYETGKPQESERHYLKALELEPQSVENHLALAEFYTRIGLRIKAFTHLNIILQLQPNHERALEMLNIKKSAKRPLYEISEN